MEDEFDHLLRGGSEMLTAKSAANVGEIKGFTTQQVHFDELEYNIYVFRWNLLHVCQH
jgi:hypothetical protein